MLRKTFLFILLAVTLFSGCKKVDPELPADITFKAKNKFAAVGTNDTAFVKIDGNGQNGTVKYIPSDSAAVSIIRETNDYVVYKQNSSGNNYYITAGYISSGQLKSKDTLWLNAAGVGASKLDIVSVWGNGYGRSGLMIISPTTGNGQKLSVGISYPGYPSWSSDRKSILVNDMSYGGFTIYSLTGSVVSTHSAYGIGTLYQKNRFSKDGKAIYGVNPSGGYIVKDYVSKSTISLPITVTNSSVVALAIGSTTNNIAYVSKVGSSYFLFYYKNGTSKQISYNSYGYADLEISPDGNFVAYVETNLNRYSSLVKYVKLYKYQANSVVTVDYPDYSTDEAGSPSFNSTSNQLVYAMENSYYSNFNTYYSDLIFYDIDRASYKSINILNKSSLSSYGLIEPCW